MDENIIDLSSQNSSEVTKRFPFMSAFPFECYKIFLEKEEPDLALDIDPIIINSVGSLESPKQLSFIYLEQDTQIMLSFYESDVDFIQEQAKNIKYFDMMRKVLDDALENTSIRNKMLAIKESEKFLSEVNPLLIANSSFIGVLHDLLGTNDIHLSARTLASLQKMNVNLKEEKFTEKEKSVISAYFNFHLHHAKIILGMVVAAKIY